MYKISLVIAALCCTLLSAAQQNLTIKVVHADTKEPLTGATVQIRPLDRTEISDSSGILVFRNLAAGKYELRVSYVEFGEETVSVTIPYIGVLEIGLEP